MNVKKYMMAQPSAKIEGELLLELLCSELRSSEQNNPQRGEDLEVATWTSEESSDVPRRVER